MHLNGEHPSNRGVLEYLCRRAGKSRVPTIESATTSARSTWEYGSHPDVVEYLWDDLGAGLPEDCRAVVCGSPALVAPRRGVVFAVSLGTEYALRLPPREFDLARAAGAEVVHLYSTVGVTLDLTKRFGPHWVFGLFDPREREWSRAALDFAEASA